MLLTKTRTYNIGRLGDSVTVRGNIVMNGNKRCFNQNSREVSYVAQEEVFLGTLTVRETLTHSANLRLPSGMSREEIRKVVEETLIEMGLEECADNKLGNWHLRGISNGEKKRLSIGLEILTQPHVLILDEPTSGLDSASAFFVMQTLAKLANDGRVVVCSIHQPSSEIYNLFDDILLLSSGETVYFGEATMALKFFADAGFPCPTKRNPSDHFLMCVNLDFDIIAAALMKSQPIIPTSSNSAMGMKMAEIRATLIERYKSSEQMINARRRIQCLKSSGDQEQEVESNKVRSRRCWKQLCTLTHRSFTNMCRDIGYHWMRILFYILVAFGVGTFFFHIGTGKDSILARGKFVSFIYGFMVFYGERSKGHYGVGVFVISNFLSSFPFLVIASLFLGIIIYSMVQFHLGFSHAVFFFLNLFLCLSVLETCMMVVASLVPNVLIGIGAALGVLVFTMMGSPLLRPLPDIPRFFWRYPVSYLSFATWAVQGHYKNDIVGLEFDPLIAGNPKVKGEEVLKLIIGISLNHDKWWDITALILMLLAYRFLLFLLLKRRLPTNVSMTGNVLLNGNKRSSECRDISYVTQDDCFLGTLTVRETLTYTAHLRLPTNLTKDEIDKMVNHTLAEMGLQDCADTRIGNWHLRGISNGEKRRLSISLEILTQPHILFLDEPTSGLDSAAAFYVVLSLRNIALEGRIVICSIHQPNSEVFDLFDDMVLLAAGETVYFGESKMAVKFFDNAGFPCPTRKNPPDHFLRCVSSEFDRIATLMQSGNVNDTSSSSPWNSLMDLTTEEIKAELIKNYKNSTYSTNAKERIRAITLSEKALIESKSCTSSWNKHLFTLTHRSFLNMFRDFGYYWLRIIFYILVSITAGFLYFNIGASNRTIMSRSKCDGFIYGFMICLCIGGLPFFLEELKVFSRERFGRHYGEGIYVLSNFLSSFPFVLAISLSSGTILYHMVNFHPGFTHYCYFCINLFCCIAITESCILIVAALVSNLLLAIGSATGVTGQFKNDLIGLEFEGVVPGDAKIKGEVILEDIFGIKTNYSKWWDLGALVCLLILYRLLFYFTLKHRERASSLFHNLLTSSLLKQNYISSSKRRQILYPLSAQEAFSSPMS
ncbi:ABC transporter G family member 15-like [Senna tora]|uniref:ABC transporter G family member 15-like n=1 Tax=Senna tora TaxID=362788 RepID=A0A834SHC4_9FABA|nr:ABC transporter G family member 15-like [Senna tora]